MPKPPPHELPDARAALVERRTQALALRRAGRTYDEIAEELGYFDASGARKAVMAAIGMAEGHLAAEAADMIRGETEELAAQRAEVWSVIAGPGVHIEVIRPTPTEENPDPLPEVVTTEIPQDPDVKLRAIAQLVKISHRLAQLHGLDQPAKLDTQTTVRYEIDGVDMSKLS